MFGFAQSYASSIKRRRNGLRMQRDFVRREPLLSARQTYVNRIRCGAGHCNLLDTARNFDTD